MTGASLYITTAQQLAADVKRKTSYLFQEYRHLIIFCKRGRINQIHIFFFWLNRICLSWKQQNYLFLKRGSVSNACWYVLVLLGKLSLWSLCIDSCFIPYEALGNLSQTSRAHKVMNKCRSQQPWLGIKKETHALAYLFLGVKIWNFNVSRLQSTGLPVISNHLPDGPQRFRNK